MKKHSLVNITAFFLSVLLSVTACRQPTQIEELQSTSQIRVVTTIFPPFDFVRQVGGQTVSIRMLIKPGSDPHSYDPTPSDIHAIEQCDVFIMTGGESDAWAETLLDSINTESMQIVRMLSVVPPLHEEITSGMTVSAHSHEDSDHAAEEHNHETYDTEQQKEIEKQYEEYDEHVWTSPKNAQLICAAILDALCTACPAEQAALEERAAAYQAQLCTLDQAYTQVISQAVRHTVLFADRFPFRYLTHDYNLTYHAAFPGCSSRSEPSIHTMLYLIDAIRAEHIPVIYVVERSNRNIAQVIADETGANILELHSCHTVSQQELKSGVTYISLMYQNLENLKKGLSQ